jgi:hypothetical protein
MITRPEDVTKVDPTAEGAWDGVSVDRHTGRENPNKETTMDWAEHQRIVFEARGLLASAITHTGDVKKAFNALKSAFEDQTSRTEVRVSKGIHQPFSNPHLQMRTVSTFRGAPGAAATEVVHKFHLNVSAVDTKEIEGRFRWVGVQFTYLHKSETYSWPKLPAAVQNKRDRRASISFASLAEHMTKLKEEELAKDLAAQGKTADDEFAKECLRFETLHSIKIGSKSAFRNGKQGYNKLPDGREIRYRYNSESKTIALV